MNLNTSALGESELTDENYRSTLQPILPQQIIEKTSSDYSVYPIHSLTEGKIFKGYDTLAAWMIGQKTVLIEGFAGILWGDIFEGLNKEFQNKSLDVKWHFTSDYLKPGNEIQQLLEPFLGSPDSVWGKKCSLKLSDFFDTDKFNAKPDSTADVNIIFGTGAALFDWKAPVVYLEIPKNELQYRMAAGSITNLGSDCIQSQPEMYKRFFFVDWVILNEHKKLIQDQILVIADTQWKDTLNWIHIADLKEKFSNLSQNAFRPRPWFTPGSWGGQWMKEHLNGLNKDEVNYAWSFEFIAPESGLVFESDGNLLEVAFDWFMLYNRNQIMGRDAEVFGMEFPIRFDFLDTFDGGNLSIQCHPTLKYIREVFGQNITQDETYYILDCKEDAKVYLGFQENIDPVEFKKTLQDSQNFNQEVDIEKFVQSHPAKKHELFLIPSGTIHSSGTNNLVLEISATPYIFTFKMYDWLSLGLDGQPRPINIEHAFNNLNFERKGENVADELISKQVTLKKGDDWQLVSLPTHKEHFFNVERIEFDSVFNAGTNNSCHVLMLVEGTSIDVQTEDGTITNFKYAETFLIPAAAENYKLINSGNERAKVIRAFVKDNISFLTQ